MTERCTETSEILVFESLVYTFRLWLSNILDLQELILKETISFGSKKKKIEAGFEHLSLFLIKVTTKPPDHDETRFVIIFFFYQSNFR